MTNNNSDIIQHLNWMTVSCAGHRNNWTGQVGYEFIANKSFEITALLRGIFDDKKNKLIEETTVTLWDVDTKNILIQLQIGPHSLVKNNYAFEYISDMYNNNETIILLKGKLYRITQLCKQEMKDKWNDSFNFDTNHCLNDYATLTQGCFNNINDITTFPHHVDGKKRRFGMLSFCVLHCNKHKFIHLLYESLNYINIPFTICFVIYSYCYILDKKHNKLENVKLNELTNWMTKSYAGNRNNFNGEVGFEFKANKDFYIGALGVGLSTVNYNNQLCNSFTVTLWNAVNASIMTSVEIQQICRTSELETNQYVFEKLKHGVIKITKGNYYRLTLGCYSGMNALWNDAHNFDINDCLREFATLIQGCYSRKIGWYPLSVDGENRRPGMLSFCIFQE
eukprot:483928_1